MCELVIGGKFEYRVANYTRSERDGLRVAAFSEFE